MSWFGNAPGIPGSCFPSMGSMGSMDGSMHGGGLFGPRPPPLGSPDGSVHGATLAQQACTSKSFPPCDRSRLSPKFILVVACCRTVLWLHISLGCIHNVCSVLYDVNEHPAIEPFRVRLQQASTGGDGSGHSGTLAMGALAPQGMSNGHLQHASQQVQPPFQLSLPTCYGSMHLRATAAQTLTLPQKGPIDSRRMCP